MIMAIFFFYCLFNYSQQHNDRNNNNVYKGDGAVALMNPSNASAEIEGEESEMVSVDTPIAPERDLIAMLKQTKAIPNDVNDLILKSYFVAVEEEKKQSNDLNNAVISDHIRDLLQKYQNDEESK